MGTANDSECRPPQTLSLDQMFEKYPREEVEKIIFQRDYFKSRDELIRQFEDHIQKGFNAESCEEALKTLLRTTPSHPPVDPSEPSNLLPDTLWRIRCLKYLLSSDMYSDLDIVNVNAVLTAYRTEKIHVNPSQCTVWYAGILVMGPVSCMKLKIEDYIDLIPEWREKYGPGQVWVEDVCQSLILWG